MERRKETNLMCRNRVLTLEYRLSQTDGFGHPSWPIARPQHVSARLQIRLMISPYLFIGEEAGQPSEVCITCGGGHMNERKEEEIRRSIKALQQSNFRDPRSDCQHRDVMWPCHEK